MGRPVAELLGGRPPVRVEVSGPGLRQVLLSGLLAALLGLLVPGKVVPVVAAAWLVWLAAQVRISATGGGAPPISSRELSEWMAFYRLEPWGAEVEDWRFGMLASVVANANRDPKRRRKPYEPTDFMPRRDRRPAEEQTWEEQARILEMWMRAFEAKYGG